ncbi:hypothetical protein HK097_001835 [Rhizophlyctis rosea]|uniref:Uncharacterized protein n=1 Tax=Rhizophlyctis rosea TaxID=64517 RepID=A0AAD5SN22_9FUNG|nr:hypothetical protein HK097_001835 [Rhizophlyctis rosea]
MDVAAKDRSRSTNAISRDNRTVARPEVDAPRPSLAPQKAFEKPAAPKGREYMDMFSPVGSKEKVTIPNLKRLTMSKLSNQITPAAPTAEDIEKSAPNPLPKKEHLLRNVQSESVLDMFSPLAASKTSAASKLNTPTPSAEVDSVLPTSPTGRSLRKTQTVSSLMERFRAGAMRVPVKDDDRSGAALDEDRGLGGRTSLGLSNGATAYSRLGRMTSHGTLGRRSVIDEDDPFGDTSAGVEQPKLSLSRSTEALMERLDQEEHKGEGGREDSGVVGYATISGTRDVSVRGRPSLSSFLERAMEEKQRAVGDATTPPPASPPPPTETLPRSPVRSPAKSETTPLADEFGDRLPIQDMKDRIFERLSIALSPKRESIGGLVGTEELKNVSPRLTPPKPQAQQPYQSPVKLSKIPVATPSSPPIVEEEMNGGVGGEGYAVGQEQGQGQGIQYRILEGIVEECLQEFRMQVREDIRDMHLELLRQFQIQKNEIEDMFRQYSPTEAMVREVNALREENARLRRNY